MVLREPMSMTKPDQQGDLFDPGLTSREPRRADSRSGHYRLPKHSHGASPARAIAAGRRLAGVSVVFGRVTRTGRAQLAEAISCQSS